MKVGANYSDDKCDFTVWAPNRKEIKLIVLHPSQKEYPMTKGQDGYFRLQNLEIKPGAEYLFRIDRKIERPDPASGYQPHGVGGPSGIIDHSAFQWKNCNWSGLRLEEMIMYELHIGTFTEEGTFSAAINKVNELLRLGANAIELMPVAQFSGSRNWGYDGVFPYSVQNTYGGPEELKQLVDYCHTNGIAVFLDVVFNHLGPEGNVLEDYAPYFSKITSSSWGSKPDFDGPFCSEIRNYFAENALHWLTNYHIDGLRLDAAHAIHDTSPKHFLKELAEIVGTVSRNTSIKRYLVAESDLNDSSFIRSIKAGGYGLDAQWLDDYHHALHAVLTDERNGYYEDFGDIELLANAILNGFVYTGQYSKYRRKPHGHRSSYISPRKFIVFSQNHDQIGNRLHGERLITLTGFEAAKVAAGMTLLSPYVPLLFMGEEIAEDAPFLYFTSFSDKKLARAVRQGRSKEFASFGWQGEPADPQSEETFLSSKINWQRKGEMCRKKMLAYYRALIRLRKQIPSFRYSYRSQTRLLEQRKDRLLWIKRWSDDSSNVIAANLGEHDSKCRFPFRKGKWLLALDSSDAAFAGVGTLIPKTITYGEEVLLRANSFSVFLKAETEGRP